MKENEKKKLKEDIMGEQESIEDILHRLQHIQAEFNSQKKDYVTEPAMGTYLMNFYNGVENIIKRASKVYYHTMPRGNNWHKDLLLLAANPPNNKEAIITEGIAMRLGPYMKFRHRFISGYGFQLESEKMAELISNCNDLWNDIKNSIEQFLKKL